MTKAKTKVKSKKDFRASAVTPAAMLLEGMLNKRSTGVVKRWQKRYFAVAGHYLKYADGEDDVEQTPKAAIDLQALKSCLLKRQRYLQLEFTDGMALELQADTAEEAEEWRAVLLMFIPSDQVRKASTLESLAHYAPRKGTLVFESKAGGASPPAAATAAAVMPAPAPAAVLAQKARRLSLSDRIAKLEAEVLGSKQQGGSKIRLEALENDVLGEAQQGPMPARVKALEEEYGLEQPGS